MFRVTMPRVESTAYLRDRTMMTAEVCAFVPDLMSVIMRDRCW